MASERKERCIILHYGMARRHAEQDVGDVIHPYRPTDRRITYVGEDYDLERTCGLRRDTPWAYVGRRPGPKALTIMHARFGEPVKLEEALNQVDFAYGP